MKYTVGILLILIGFTSCKTNKQIQQTESVQSFRITENKLPPELIIGKIIEIDSTKSVYKIVVMNNQKHTILSRKNSAKLTNTELLNIGLEYKFKVIPLTHVSIRNGTFNQEINGIAVMPNFAVQDCIKFNGEKFCSDEGEVYQGININGLYINTEK